MANALSSMIQREQSTDAEKRNALAPDPGWTAPKLEGVPSRWTTESDAPWLHRLARDAKEVGDASARVTLDAPWITNK